LITQPRRRRASAALGPARPWHYLRAALAIVLGAALLLGGIGGVRVWSAIHAIAPRAQPQDIITLVQAQTDDPESLAYKIKHDQRLNILLLGYGGPGHEGPYLTDSIMLVSIQPAAKQAIMISLPRDLYVKIPALPRNGYMWGKLNLAYAVGSDHRNYPNVRSEWKVATGAGDLAAATVAQITGQRIDYWVGVDFKAFRDVVNALDGIQVKVPTVLDDPKYPRGETNGVMHIHFNAGLQQMNGEQALEYARSRETTSDFDRSKRQQLIMLAVRQRVFSLNAIPKLFSVVSALQDNVRTNLKPQDFRPLADLAGQIKDHDVRRIAVDTTNFLRSGYSRDGQYVLQPLDSSFATLQRYLAAILPDRTVLTAQLPFQVQDASRRYWVPYGAPTPAGIMTALLQAAGLNASAGPASPQRITQTEILDGSGGKSSATVIWLQTFFGAVVKPVAAPTSGPTVTVLLGSDFTAKAFPPH
jgi:LCP family protein required for cell wall assembly